MTPDKISKRVAVDRLSWVDDMVFEIRALPLENRNAFFEDKRNIWAAESCLRRALEALFDLGRHILAKGFASGVSEYKEIASTLHHYGVLDGDQESLLLLMAGYRNRMVHFYHEIEADELFDICSDHLEDVNIIAAAFRNWLNQHPDLLDETL